MSAAIEYLAEYKISSNDLASLSDDEKATLGVLSFAVSEINALKRIYLFCAHPLTKKPEINSAIWIQRNLVLRTWSAKLFEFLLAIEEIAKHSKSPGGSVLSEFADEAEQLVESFRAGEGFEFARDSRNEAANHYSIKAAKKNVRFVDPEADCPLFIHKLAGNSFFPYGEEVMFIGRLLRKNGQTKTAEERLKVFEEWLDWNLAVTTRVDEVHLVLLERLFFNRYPERTAIERDYWIDPALVGSVEDVRVPIFLRDESK